MDGGVVVAPDGAQVTVLADAGSPVASAILEAVSRSTALTVDGIIGRRRRSRSAVGDARRAGRPGRRRAVTRPDRRRKRGRRRPRRPTAAGMATFFLFFTVQFGVLGLLEGEAREGTLARILAASWPRQLLKLVASSGSGEPRARAGR
ncbi:MAG: hypothetical protein R2734_17725 [Nocardioides sp.]